MRLFFSNFLFSHEDNCKWHEEIIILFLQQKIIVSVILREKQNVVNFKIEKLSSSFIENIKNNKTKSLWECKNIKVKIFFMLRCCRSLRHWNVFEAP